MKQQSQKQNVDLIICCLAALILVRQADHGAEVLRALRELLGTHLLTLTVLVCDSYHLNKICVITQGGRSVGIK